jgi:hypothetical protein
MKKKPATDKPYSCEHCGAGFVREASLFTHLCEKKRRWDERDMPSSRLGYIAWLEFYKRNYPSKKDTDFKAFAKSTYYTGFIKFGLYCHSINAINPTAFMGWLLSNKVAIDNWTSDAQYEKYLVEYLRLEDHGDAIKRSIETLAEIAEEQGMLVSDVLRVGNANKICHLITVGKISPWIIYNCDSGIEFMGHVMRSGQVQHIYKYIDPEIWQIKFKRQSSDTEIVKQALKHL